MKKIFSILASLSVVVACAGSQPVDSEACRSCVDAVVAAMPAENAETLESLMADLAQYAPDCVIMLSDSLKPAEEGANSKLEYAISGLIRYASVHPKVKAKVTEGFDLAIQSQTDSVSKAFLQAETRLLGVAPEACKVASLAVLKASAVIEAMSLADRSSRVRALDSAPSGNAFYRKLAAAPKADGADADVLYFLGERKAVAAMDYVLEQIGGPFSEDAETAAARIGGRKAAKALCEIASPALFFFNGNFSGELADAYSSADSATKQSILEIAAKRHMTSFFQAALEAERYDLLAGLASAEDCGALANLLNTCDDSQIASVSEAYAKAASQTPDMLAVVKADFTAASKPEIFYPALAATGTDEAVEILAGEYREGSAASLDALASMNNPEVADILLEASADNDRYLDRFVSIMEASRAAGSAPEDEVVLEKYVQALGYAQNADSKAQIIRALRTLETPNVLYVVEPYLDDESLSREAALSAAKAMVRYTSEIDSDRLGIYSSRVKSILLSTGYADDAYAVDEINLALDKTTK